MNTAPVDLLSLFFEPCTPVSEGPATISLTRLAYWRTWVTENLSGVAQSHAMQLLYIVYTRDTAEHLRWTVGRANN
jgi:hypothetical protein